MSTNQDKQQEQQGIDGECDEGEATAPSINAPGPSRDEEQGTGSGDIVEAANTTLDVLVQLGIMDNHHNDDVDDDEKPKDHFPASTIEQVTTNVSGIPQPLLDRISTSIEGMQSVQFFPPKSEQLPDENMAARAMEPVTSDISTNVGISDPALTLAVEEDLPEEDLRDIIPPAQAAEVGAYSVIPSVQHEQRHLDPSQQGEAIPVITQLEPNTPNLIEASLVPPEQENLPVASSIDPMRLQAIRDARSRTRAKLSAFAVIAVVLVVAGTIFLTTFLVSQQQDPSLSSGFPNHTNFSTPIVDPWDILPNYARSAINETDSPQQKAYQWLINDSGWQTYSEKRLIQRFALATLYYATNGDSWRKNTSWLSYSVPECEWYFSRDIAVIESAVGNLSEIVSVLSKGNTTGNSIISFLVDVYRVSPDLLVPILLENSRLPCFQSPPLEVGEDQKDGYETLPFFPWQDPLAGVVEGTNEDTLSILLLQSNGLSGTLPPELYLLTSLQLVVLVENTIQGSISTLIGTLSRMMLLALDSCQIDGTIPSELGEPTELLGLTLSNNRLEGSIASHLFLLTNLYLLNLEDNKLTGNIPSELGLVSKNLRQVYLGNNHLTSIPSEVGLLSRLAVLFVNAESTANLPSEVSQMAVFGNLTLLINDNAEEFSPPTEVIDWCKLIGYIPTEVGLLLQRDRLECNCYWGCNVTGTLPTHIGLLTGLTSLTVSGSEVYGPLPSELGFLSLLESLSLSSNRLTGTLPTELGLLTSLQFWDSYSNFFNGSMPTELGLLTSLKYVAMFDNGFTGLLPTELALLTSLEYTLWLDNNTFSGSLPSEFGLLTSLSQLLINFNMLTGPLPTELALLTSLEALWLANNTFTGSLPSELGLLTRLSWLSMYFNDLTGPLPTELALLTSVQGLHLDFNSVNGSVPSELGLMSSLAWLDLTGNHLTGSLPTEVGLLTNLHFLQLSDNSFSSSLPSEMGLLTNLAALSLGRNQLTGSLPSELGLLTGLEYLVLDNNRLNSSLPSEVGLMLSIRELNLNGNHFSGAIPSEFGLLLNMTLVDVGNNSFTS